MKEALQNHTVAVHFLGDELRMPTRPALNRADLLACLWAYGEAHVEACASVLGYVRRATAQPGPSPSPPQEEAVPSASAATRPTTLPRAHFQEEEAVLSSAMSTPIATTVPDMPLVVDTLARGQFLRHLPTIPRQGWAPTCQVLLDYAAPLRPFWTDITDLQQHLGQMRGRSGLMVLALQDDEPGGPCWLAAPGAAPAAGRMPGRRATALPTALVGWGTIAAVHPGVLGSGRTTSSPSRPSPATGNPTATSSGATRSRSRGCAHPWPG